MMKPSRFALLALLTTLALVVVPAVAAAEEIVPTFDLSGAWRLDRTENFDEYLKKSGTPWWKRKLEELGSSRLRQTIEQDGIEFEIESQSPVETRKDALVADGVTPREAETASGDMMTWTARIEDEGLVVDGHGDLGHRIVRREIIEGRMVMTILNPDADAECRLYFEPVATE
jgi:hypothetical protein